MVAAAREVEPGDEALPDPKLIEEIAQRARESATHRGARKVDVRDVQWAVRAITDERRREKLACRQKTVFR